MAVVTEPLRAEHKELLPHIERLRAVADSVGQVSPATLRQEVDKVYDFLAHHIIPHAEAEERDLYPVVGRIMGSPEATATMSRDHVAIGHLVKALSTLRSKLTGEAVGASVANDLRRVLYGLYTLLSVHFAKEEEIYLPLLDARLPSDEAQRMFAQMHAVAKKAHGPFELRSNARVPR